MSIAIKEDRETKVGTELNALVTYLKSRELSFDEIVYITKEAVRTIGSDFIIKETK